MILIRFPNTESKRSALAQLAGRFSFKSWASGEMLVLEDALPSWQSKASRSPSRGRRPMSRMVRRFEVLLPLRFNDGTPVPDAAVADTLLEFEERFGAVSCETQTIRGRWRSEGRATATI